MKIIDTYSLIAYFIIISLSFTSCVVKKNEPKEYEEEDKTICYVSKQSNERSSVYTFEPQYDNSIAFVFEEEFKDTIEVEINNKKYIKFYKNDLPTINSDGTINKVFDGSKSIVIKTARLRKRNNKVAIFLKNTRKRVTFNVNRNNKIYVISYYDNFWSISSYPE